MPPSASAWVPWPETIVLAPAAPYSVFLVAHELQHVVQWRRYGWSFPLRYVWQWVCVGFRYQLIPFEVEARELAYTHTNWATEVLRKHMGEGAYA